MKKRSEIEEKYKWDISDYYNSLKNFEDDYNFVKSNLYKFKSYENKLNNDAIILEYLNFSKTISLKLNRLYVFASLKTKEDATNCESEELLEKVDMLETKHSEVTSFVSSEFSKLSNEYLCYLKNNRLFEDYNVMFEEIIRHKKHILSKKEEQLLSGMSFVGGFSDIFDKFENADVKFKDVENSKGEKLPLNQALFSKYMQSDDRVLRKNALINLNQGFGDYNYTISANYINHIKEDCYFSKIRKYKSALESALYDEQIPEKVYSTLIQSVEKNISVFYKYYELKRQQLNLDEMALYDFSAPTSNDFQIEVEFENAMEYVYSACSPLGSEYVNLLKKSKADRWIDVYPSKGKDNGAFSWGTYGCKPVVLLNYSKTTNDVFTIAHELGHAMHTYYSNKNQVYQKAGYEIFVAEVASTVNEMLLIRHLVSNAKSDLEKVYYYDYFLKMARTTIARQTMFAEFEQFAHSQFEKEIPLSSQILNDYYMSLIKKYFGNNVKLINEIKYEWTRIPHFYSSFYVYKYATGLISAIIISEKLFNKEKDYKDKYIKFLSSGCSKSPIDLLKIVDVDLEKPETFEFAFKVINDFVIAWQNILEKK